MSAIGALVTWLLRFRRVGVVLLGHGLTVGGTDEYIASYHDDFDTFANTIGEYEDLDFEFVSMENLLALSQNNFEHDRNWVHLTFDDGYQSVYSRAYPYLRERQIPFSLFISTGHIERSERFYVYRIRCSLLHTKRWVRIPDLEHTLPVDAPRQERIKFSDHVTRIFRRMSKSQAIDLMAYIDSLLPPKEWESYNDLYCEDEVLTIEQVQELAADELVHVGSHNHNHIILNRNVSEEDVLFEMQTSQDWLHRNLGARALTYCYPSGARGDFTPNSRSICQMLGYQLAFTTITDFVSHKTDRYEIPRVGISTSSNDFHRRLLKFFLPDSVVRLVRLLKTP
jgi:peptidoglycan/xylan/chitin deacetylase (PgdA/CDA1 family)